MIDYPTQVPRRPDGSVNTEQLRREFFWGHASFLNGNEHFAYGGNKHLTNPPTVQEFVNHIVLSEHIMDVLERDLFEVAQSPHFIAYKISSIEL